MISGYVTPGSSYGLDTGSATGLSQVRAALGLASTDSPTTAGPSPRTLNVKDSVTLSPEASALRDRVRDLLTELRAELEDRSAATAGTSQPKSLQDLLDEEFDHGLGQFEKYRHRVRAAEPYLTETDKSMLGLLYEKYEKKYGEDAWELKKVDRFAGELATLRMMGVLVESDEAKEAAKAREQRRVDRAERAAADEQRAERSRDRHERDLTAIDDLAAAAADPAYSGVWSSDSPAPTGRSQARYEE